MFVEITMKKCVIADFTEHMIINLQTWKMFTLLLFRQNDRCPEIAFSGYQNAENQQNENHNKNREQTLPL